MWEMGKGARKGDLYFFNSTNWKLKLFDFFRNGDGAGKSGLFICVKKFFSR